jgi:aspartyl-tRNA(Asn)/glutamyl-tRNA(Gln) amidotransferase subunit A
MCAVALGTDTGGSVRIPAALNGVSGLRPTLGRVSNRGVFPITWSFDTVGPMARSVADLAPLLAVLAGFDPEDSSSVRRAPDNYLAGLELDLEGMRLGLAGGVYAEDVDEENLAAIRAAAKVFERLGAVVEEVELPGADEAFEAANQLVRAEAFAIHRERLATQPDLFGADVRRRLARRAGDGTTTPLTARQAGGNGDRAGHSRPGDAIRTGGRHAAPPPTARQSRRPDGSRA